MVLWQFTLIFLKFYFTYDPWQFSLFSSFMGTAVNYFKKHGYYYPKNIWYTFCVCYTWWFFYTHSFCVFMHILKVARERWSHGGWEREYDDSANSSMPLHVVLWLSKTGERLGVVAKQWIGSDVYSLNSFCVCVWEILNYDVCTFSLYSCPMSLYELTKKTL